MIYVFDQFDYYNSEKMDILYRFLPPKRKKKALSYFFLKDRKLCCLSYLLLIYGMISEGLVRYDISSFVDFQIDKNGKPFINDQNSIQFNISHCDKAVACGISCHPIGVDVQDFDTQVDEDTMRLAFSVNEISDIHKSASIECSIARYWAIKESYYKCLGTGINDNMDQIDFSVFHSDNFIKEGLSFGILKMKNYYLSVCERKLSSEKLNVFNISPQQLEEVLFSFLL